jgi:hypothetical protein
MSLYTEIDHRCDGCSFATEPDQCYCDSCLDSLKQEAYEEGKKDGYKEGHANALEEGNI